MTNFFRKINNKTPKFRNKKVVFEGETFDSQKELRRFHELNLLRKSKQDKVVEVKRGVRLPFILNGKKMFDYLPDFVVHYEDGRVEYEDVKGGAATITPLFKLKKKIIEEFYQIEIKII